jgi:uncharacterized protein YdaT
MSEPSFDERYEEWRKNKSKSELEDLFENTVDKFIKADIDKALEIVNNKIDSERDHAMQESNNQNNQYLLELKARVLWHMKNFDKGMFSFQIFV